jgi:hypothetical protein
MKIYGRLDCPAALRVIARGGYVRYRVFFADEETAIATWYRPCGTCCKDRYLHWMARQRTEGKRRNRRGCVPLLSGTLRTLRRRRPKRS